MTLNDKGGDYDDNDDDNDDDFGDDDEKHPVPAMADAEGGDLHVPAVVIVTIIVMQMIMMIIIWSTSSYNTMMIIKGDLADSDRGFLTR